MTRGAAADTGIAVMEPSIAVRPGRLGPRAPFSSIDGAFSAAKRRLPRMVYERVAGGSAPLTQRVNTKVFDEIAFHPKAAVVFEDRDLRTTVLGDEISMPVMLASPGGARILHPAGEPAAAAAAGRAGTINVVSMSTGHSPEAVAARAFRPLWQQMYMSRGRDGAEELMSRCKAAGYRALVLTVDLLVSPTPVIPGVKPPAAGITRENFFQLTPDALKRPRWLMAYLRDRYGERGVTEIERLGVCPYSPESRLKTGELVNKMTATWEDFRWIKERWGGPIVAKGILTPDDARRAVDAGVSAVIVSNHGAAGMIDTFPSSLRMLPDIAEAVGDQCDVLLDSGLRSGAHVVKALALGAKACLIGRPYLMGLAAAGEEGVYQVLEIFRREIDGILGALGCPSVRALDPSYVEVPTNWPRWNP